jgi:hypothetical protein
MWIVVETFSFWMLIRVLNGFMALKLKQTLNGYDNYRGIDSIKGDSIKDSIKGGLIECGASTWENLQPSSVSLRFNHQILKFIKFTDFCSYRDSQFRILQNLLTVKPKKFSCRLLWLLRHSKNNCSALHISNKICFCATCVYLGLVHKERP